MRSVVSVAGQRAGFWRLRHSWVQHNRTVKREHTLKYVLHDDTADLA
jgi:hypothetical protein